MHTSANEAFIDPPMLALPVIKRLPAVAGDLCRPGPFICPELTNQQVFELFSKNPTLTTLPVVENEQPIGLIDRNLFMNNFAMPFRREIFARKSCIAFMDKQPLIAERDVTLGELCRMASLDNGKALRDGFIIVYKGRFEGTGTGNDLLTGVADLQAEKNHQIQESIDYASVIQRSFLRPSRAALSNAFPATRRALVWEPRDTVGGDCFYARHTDDGLLVVLMDCTGHGVPGALMTMIVMSFVDHAVESAGSSAPAAVLDALNGMLKLSLDQHHNRRSPLDTQMAGLASEGSDDGMDAMCLWLDKAQRELRFAGAHSGLLLIDGARGQIEDIPGDKHGVGHIATPDDFRWTTQVRSLKSGDRLILSTDGIIDQIGGPKRLAFGRRRLNAELTVTARQSLAAQVNTLMHQFKQWQGDEARRDDVSLIALEV